MDCGIDGSFSSHASCSQPPSPKFADTAPFAISADGMAPGAYEISPDMAREADEPSLPALPKVSPDRWRQEYTGCSTVLAITLTDLVLVHANGWADAAANGAFTQLHGALMLAVDGLAVLAMLMLAGVMCGGRDLVVRRTTKTVTPLPPAVRELLIAGESLDGLANLVDGDDSYCVRCCVWRRPPPPPTPICCGGSGGGRSCRPMQPSNRAHHCRYCGECVLGFDHHCGFFGRCITGSLLYGGGNMRAFIGIIRCKRTRTRTRTRMRTRTRSRTCTCTCTCTRTCTCTCTRTRCMGGIRMCMASAWCTMHVHAYIAASATQRPRWRASLARSASSSTRMAASYRWHPRVALVSTAIVATRPGSTPTCSGAPLTP